METVKSVVKWVLAPLTLLLGAIYFLLTKNNALKAELATKEAEKNLAVTVTKIDGAKKDADTQEDDYRRKLADFQSAMDDYSKGRLPDDTK